MSGSRASRGRKFQGENVLMVASCVGGGDVMCCHVMWYDAMCLVPRGREDRQCAWLQDVMLCDVMLCDVM